MLEDTYFQPSPCSSDVDPLVAKKTIDAQTLPDPVAPHSLLHLAIVVLPHEIWDGPGGSSLATNKASDEKMIVEVEETNTEEERFMGDLMAGHSSGSHS